jgi:MFS family permease
LIPDRATSARRADINLLFAARGIRGFGDGFAVILLPAYLSAIGYDPIRIGVVAAASLLGSAVLTLAVGFLAPRFDASGKKWVRFAAWDSAGNGALTQPVHLK